MEEKYLHIIRLMKNARPVSAPEDLTDRILAAIAKTDKKTLDVPGSDYFLKKGITRPGKATFTEPVTTISQCAFIYLTVGFFYFIAGSVTILGLSGILSSFEIPAWLKIQPWLALASGIFMLISAFLMLRQPILIRYIHHAMFIHIGFLLINALILEFIVSFSGAVVYIFTLTAAAFVFGVLLLAAIRSLPEKNIAGET